MKIWRVNNNSSSSNGNKVRSVSNQNISSNDVIILGGKTSKQQQQQQQQQHSTPPIPLQPIKEVEQVHKESINLKSSTGSARVPSMLFLSEPLPPPPAVVVEDDTRNDSAAMIASSPIIVEKKERKQHIISIGRNSSRKNIIAGATTATMHNKSSSSRDLPEGEALTTPTIAAAPSSSSYALSRLLFTKQHMEQRDQMKVVYTQFGSSAIDTLTVEPEEGMPSPDHADHVVVKIQASTVTLDDCLLRRGFDFNIFDPICLPQTPGHDIVGHICVRGSKVDASFEEGDRVAALIRTGGNARFVSIPSSCLIKIPRNIDSAEAVAMVSTFTTAYQTLKRIKQQGPMFSLLGKRVLILGAMDGVGQALIQMCLKARAEIYAPCPRSCHNYMKNVLGAHPLPEEKDQWLLLVESQMDYVFDGVCEDGLETPQKALTAEGELVCYGHTSMLKETEIGIFGAPLSAHMNKLWSQTKSKAKTIDIWESFKEDPETYKKNLKSLCQLLKWNKLKPNITCRVGLSEVAEAQTKLENGELHGTIVCLPWTNMDNNKA